MNAYGFCRVDCDNKNLIILEHKQKFTKEEFEDMVNQSINKTKKQMEEGNNKFDKYIKDKIDMSDEELDDLLNFIDINNLFKNVLLNLKNDFGFKELEPIHTVEFFQ